MTDGLLETDVKEFLTNRIVCLIGFMGSGKTFIGEYLAKELGAELIETDTLIEGIENQPISQIFRERGERYFRSLEKRVLQDLVFSQSILDREKQNCYIISTGGGLPIQRGNRKLLKLLNSFNICLNPPFDVIMNRIRRTKRPLVYRRSRSHIFDLWQSRYEVYQRTADISISEVTVENVFRAINERVRLYSQSIEH